MSMAHARRLPTIWLAGPLALSLCACSGSLADKLGMDKQAPDEFAVVARQPLIVPPNFDLRPPQPGAERPVGLRPSDRAYSSLTGQPAEGATSQPEPAASGLAAAAPQATAAPQAATAPMQRPPASGPSPGQSALLAQVDAVPTDPAIREKLAAESGTAEVGRAFLVRLMQEQPAVAGQSATVLHREQRPLDDLVEESL
jgi:Protein of unknown function (DUF3035)